MRPHAPVGRTAHLDDDGVTVDPWPGMVDRAATLGGGDPVSRADGRRPRTVRGRPPAGTPWPRPVRRASWRCIGEAAGQPSAERVDDAWGVVSRLTPMDPRPAGCCRRRRSSATTRGQTDFTGTDLENDGALLVNHLEAAMPRTASGACTAASCCATEDRHRADGGRGGPGTTADSGRCGPPPVAPPQSGRRRHRPTSGPAA